MARNIVNQDEILLNNVKYKIQGPVVGSFIDPFPSQSSIGGDSYDNRLMLSQWVMNDFRDGIGVEEMDERTDGRRSYFTNCITGYRGHLLPPRLATALTMPTSVTAASITNGSMEAAANWSGGARSNTQAHAGTNSWRVLSTPATAYQDAATWTNAWRGQTFTLSGWIYNSTAANEGRMGIDDGIGITYSSYHTGGGAWEFFIVTRTLDAAATRLRVVFYGDTASGNASHFDDVRIGSPTLGTAFFANFNGSLYCASGQALLKLNGGRTAFTVVACLPSAVKALVPSLNSRLYIGLGDSLPYWYMNTSEAFFETGSASNNANWLFQHDGKLFKCNTSGTVTYSSNPDAASPTWTAAGTITDIAADIQQFIVARDASGQQVPYCVTKSVLKVYDSATPAWFDTEVKLPSHPNGGKGATYFNGKLYLSYGLGVKEYYPETGSLLDIGLTERDGLPVEYNAEITKLYGDTGSKMMFTAFDASQVTGTAKSNLAAWDGQGWSIWWTDGSNDQAITDIIVSPASSGYAVYWDVANVIYYIDIPRGVQNPNKISQSYAAAGIFISPWMDAGNAGAVKLAKYLDIFAAGITTTETATIKYRIDHANTDRDTGWTTLVALDTTGETGASSQTFASGAGIAFKSIQFRIDLVTPGSTAKPDIQAMVLSYRKRTGAEKIRRWQVKVALLDGETTVLQQVASLKSAITSNTDVAFLYRPNAASTESYNVSVECPRFDEITGQSYGGTYELVLTEV